MKAQSELLLIKIIIAPLSLLLVHIIITKLNWYEQHYWIDTPMHFFGGVSIGVSSYYLLQMPIFKFSRSPLGNFLFVVGMTALAASSWEIFEFNMDFYFASNMQSSILDTMKDLAFGLLGGLITGAILIIFSKKNLSA